MAFFTSNIFYDLVGIIIALLAIIYSKYVWIYQTWKRKGIPYLDPKFPFGNISPLYKDVSTTDDLYKCVEIAKKRGWKYCGLFAITRPIFVPIDLDLIKNILTKDFNHFTDRFPTRNTKRQDLLASTLFLMGGPRWRNLRTKLTPTFTSGKLKNMFQTLVDCGSVMEESLKKCDHTVPIDIKQPLVCFTTDIIGSCAFGLDINSFDNPNSDFLVYSRKMLQQTGSRKWTALFVYFFPFLMKILGLKVIDNDVDKFYYDVVTQTVNYREKNNYTRNDFLQLLINLKNDQGDEQNGNKSEEILTMKELVAQCFIFFIAGFETSSTTMTFALYELATHPEIQEKLRNEIIHVLNKYENKISYDSLKEMTYMQQVLDETLRMYPPLPFLSRVCIEDYKIPDSDIVLEIGTQIRIPVRNIQYDEDYYHNPQEFNPDNFTAENKNRRHQYAHLPFGEGPRNCIGMRFGLMQSQIGLATILRNFRVSLSSKTKLPLEFDPDSTIPTTKGGMWLNLEKLL